MSFGQTLRPVAWLVAGYLILSPAGIATASDMGELAAARVSQENYRHLLDDVLYTHAGHNRGFGREHDLAQGRIANLFASYGLTVTLQPVPYSGNTYYNVIGTKLGTTHPDQEYIIGAHYDSVNNPGADDNASGVALVLEAARVLHVYESELTIRFIAFDREEQGLHGAWDYVDAHLDDDILGMISADMVAYNTGADSVDIYGRSTSDPLKNALSLAVSLYGDGLGRALLGRMDGSDHAPFEMRGFQACLLEEEWGNPYYHTQQDNVDMPNYIDYAYAAKITRVVVGFLVDNAGVDVVLPYGDFDGDADVDIDDYYQFEFCFTDEGGGPVIAECQAGDFDGDDDIDCDDWEQFLLAWTEPDDAPDLEPCLLSVCGNGVVEVGEYCDTAIPPGEPGACPTDCETGEPCISDTLLDGGTCRARCPYWAVTDPIHGDGCCPDGANAVNDDDCDPVCGNGVCEEGETAPNCSVDCACADDPDCSDQYVCTLDECIDGTCTYTPHPYAYGDVDRSDAINIFDVFCIVNGFGGDFSVCTLEDDDIHPCDGDGSVNIFDMFGVLNAFGGADPCCG